MFKAKIKIILKKIFGNIFSAEQLNKNLIANFFGLQVFRYLFARIFYNLKFYISTNKDHDLKKNGYLIIENFLSSEEFNELKNEYLKAIDDKSFSSKYLEFGEGVDATYAIINDDVKIKYPLLYKLYSNEKLKSFFKINELKENVNLVAKIERIKSVSNEKKDKVRTFHYDTYFNTFKAWLYLTDVNENNGPLIILEKSHHFSLKRLLNEWITSINYSLSKDKKNWFGYGLATGNKEDAFAKAKKMIVKKNTLLFVNTNALHKRGEAESGSIRDSIHFYTRENPFKIFFN